MKFYGWDNNLNNFSFVYRDISGYIGIYRVVYININYQENSLFLDLYSRKIIVIKTHIDSGYHLR